MKEKLYRLGFDGAGEADERSAAWLPLAKQRARSRNCWRIWINRRY